MRSAGASCVLIFLVLFNYLQLGSSYNCYSCAGAPGLPRSSAIPNMPSSITTVSAACGDPINTAELGNALVPCNTPGHSCIKIDMEIEKIKVVMRGCLPPEACSVFNSCHTCTGDKCNSSSAMVPSFILVTIVSLMFTKYFL